MPEGTGGHGLDRLVLRQFAHTDRPCFQGPFDLFSLSVTRSRYLCLNHFKVADDRKRERFPDFFFFLELPRLEPDGMEPAGVTPRLPLGPA